jgi:hypothetical protein
MKKKILVIICMLTMFATIGVVYAVLTTQYSLPQTALAPVDNSPLATFTINGATWTNGAAINWGQLQLGRNTISILVVNAGPVALTPSSVTMTTTGLPSGWSETLTMGTATGAGIPGTITLYATASVTGSQSWSSVINLTA